MTKTIQAGNESMNKLSKTLALTAVLALGHAPGAVAAPDVAGDWNTNWGELSLDQDGTEVDGWFEIDDVEGVIYGELQGNVLNGYWLQDSDEDECDEALADSYTWGRLQLVFDRNGRFSGRIGYCDEGLSEGGWTGSRRPAARAPQPSRKGQSRSPEKRRSKLPSVAGSWNSDFGRLILQQSGDQITGGYPGGRLQGRLNGQALDGYWAQESGRQACSFKKFDTYYWGRFRFVFVDGRFAGSWRYCEDGPSQGGWNGTRR